MRTNEWLAERLSHLHGTYFADVEIKNTIMVRFGRSSRTRLGSIIAKEHKGYSKPVTFITVTSLFKDETVPDYVIEATLAHEMVHYTHGFHSPHKRQYQHPHKGDIVTKELRKRGAGHILDSQNAWLKKEYRGFLLQRNII